MTTELSDRLKTLTREQRWEIYREVEEYPDIRVEARYKINQEDTEEEKELKSRIIDIVITTPFGNIQKVGGTIENPECHQGHIYLDSVNFYLRYINPDWYELVSASPSNRLSSLEINSYAAKQIILSLENYLKEINFTQVDFSPFFEN